jgi:GNAT superfamily N-acetyltransferase
MPRPARPAAARPTSRYTGTVPAALTFAAEPADSPDALACVQAYARELDGIFPGGFTPAGCGVVDVTDLLPPGGGFVVARSGGAAVGCGGVRTLGPGVGEIKRMWLHPDARGGGNGRRLLAVCEELSRSLGHRVVRLDTSRHLRAAVGLYRSTGYVAIGRYNDNADADHWFEKVFLPA